MLAARESPHRIGSVFMLSGVTGNQSYGSPIWDQEEKVSITGDEHTGSFGLEARHDWGPFSATGLSKCLALPCELLSKA